MAFVMPSDMVEREVPKPSDDALRSSVRLAGRYVVLRDSGWWKPQDEERAAASVKRWAEGRGLRLEIVGSRSVRIECALSAD